MKVRSFPSSHRGCVECGHVNQIGEAKSILRHISEFTYGDGELAFAICVPCLKKLADEAEKFIPEWNRKDK